MCALAAALIRLYCVKKLVNFGPITLVFTLRICYHWYVYWGKNVCPSLCSDDLLLHLI